MNLILKYSFKLWLTVAAISVVLFQIPLFYIRHNMDVFHTAYGNVWALFFIGWAQTMLVLLFSCLLAFSLANSSYRPGWSVGKFKIVLHLLCQVCMLLSLGVFFAISNAPFIVPTPYIFLIFVISCAISLQFIRCKNIVKQLHENKMSME